VVLYSMYICSSGVLLALTQIFPWFPPAFRQRHDATEGRRSSYGAPRCCFTTCCAADRTCVCVCVCLSVCVHRHRHTHRHRHRHRHTHTHNTHTHTHTLTHSTFNTMWRVGGGNGCGTRYISYIERRGGCCVPLHQGDCRIASSCRVGVLADPSVHKKLISKHLSEILKKSECSGFI